MGVDLFFVLSSTLIGGISPRELESTGTPRRAAILVAAMAADVAGVRGDAAFRRATGALVPRSNGALEAGRAGSGEARLKAFFTRVSRWGAQTKETQGTAVVDSVALDACGSR
jgi:hypothetical protein